MKVKARVVCSQTVELEVDDKFAPLGDYDEIAKMDYLEEQSLYDELRLLCWDEANRQLGGEVQTVYRILGPDGACLYEC
jgi:hypothetical protein